MAGQISITPPTSKIDIPENERLVSLRGFGTSLLLLNITLITEAILGLLRKGGCEVQACFLGTKNM